MAAPGRPGPAVRLYRPPPDCHDGPVVPRPVDAPRFVAALGIFLSSCGHLGIDLDHNGASDGSGAASIVAVGGMPGAGGTEPSGGGTLGSGGQSAGSGGNSDGGTSGGGTSGGAGGLDGGGGSSGGGAAGTGGAATGGAGSGGSAACAGSSVPDFSLSGWANEAGGTTGGKGGTVVTVWAGGQLQNELDSKDPSTPLTILVSNTISPINTGEDKIDVADVSDVSIIGLGTDGVFDGIGLRITRASNIVVRNLHIHHVDIGEKDSISVSGPADHVWIDHCELDAESLPAPELMYDGLIDAKANVSHLTYSWNYIHDSRDPVLVGSTEMDLSDRKLTMHHNRIENCDSGTPSFRSGNGHVFNNFFQGITTLGINSRIDACLRIENNVFENVLNPYVSAYSATLGAAELICNELDAETTFDYEIADVSPIGECTATVPYDYSAVLTETSSVKALVTEHAGFGKLADPEDF